MPTIWEIRNELRKLNEMDHIVQQLLCKYNTLAIQSEEFELQVSGLRDSLYEAKSFLQQHLDKTSTTN